MILLKDVIAVKPLEQPLSSTVLEIPQTADQAHIVPIKAMVVNIGSKFRHKREVSIGDTVLVPNHLGTRHVINGERVIFYDGEDILAIISEH